jgi:hypothetical protein
MEGGRDARAHLARAAAFTVLSLLPVVLSGSAPSFVSASLPPISSGLSPEVAPGTFPWSSPLFATFHYDRGQVLGTYVQFAYDPSSGAIGSVLGLGGDLPVLFVGSIQIEGFPPARAPQAQGPTFEADGYLASITAHDDPTALIQIRTDVARTAKIELPARASNVTVQAKIGSWPASSLTYTVGGDQARFLLGAGSFHVDGIRVLAQMADSDLLVFKALPPGAAERTQWLDVLDAISAGHIVAEIDLVATSEGHWAQNIVEYRIGVAGWALDVKPGRAALQVDSLLEGGAVVLLGFDAATMPSGISAQLQVRTNSRDANRSENPLPAFVSDSRRGASYSLLSLPGTVVALYLPSLAAVSVEVVSSPPRAPSPGFQADQEVAMIAALAIVSVAAARMFRRPR